MKLNLAVLAALFAFFGTASVACSFDSGTRRFEPDLSRWEQHPGPAQTGGEGDYWEKVPTPIVNDIKITRGTKAAGSSCDDAGTLAFTVSLPDSSTYSIDEFGIYFRVKSGALPDEIFPDIPLTGVVKNQSSELFLAWLDGHPATQNPIDIEVEVFYVTSGLNIGPSSFFEIKSD